MNGPVNIDRTIAFRVFASPPSPRVRSSAAAPMDESMLAPSRVSAVAEGKFCNWTPRPAHRPVWAPKNWNDPRSRPSESTRSRAAMYFLLATRARSCLNSRARRSVGPGAVDASTASTVAF